MTACRLRSVNATLLALFASTSLAQTAAQVCAKIPYADTKVACVRAISGHQVASDAAAVCGTIPYADQVVRCLEGALDKRYDDGELEACRSIPYADQKAECVAAAGRKSTARRRAVDDEEDETDGRDARSRVRLDSTVTFDNRSSSVVLKRYYWRTPGGRWTEFGGRRALRGNSELSLEAGSGLYDFCAETNDGRSVHWLRIRLDGDEQRLSFKSRDLDDLECRDR